MDHTPRGRPHVGVVAATRGCKAGRAEGAGFDDLGHEQGNAEYGSLDLIPEPAMRLSAHRQRGSALSALSKGYVAHLAYGKGDSFQHRAYQVWSPMGRPQAEEDTTRPWVRERCMRVDGIGQKEAGDIGEE